MEKEFEGKNVDVAVWKASQELEIPIEELNYQILTQGSRGAGGEAARIRVFPPGTSAPPAVEEEAPRSQPAPEAEQEVAGEADRLEEEEPDLPADEPLDEDLDEPPWTAASPVDEDDPIEVAREARRARAGAEEEEEWEPPVASEEAPEPEPAAGPPDASAEAPQTEDLEAGLERARELLPPILEALGFDLTVDYEVRQDHVYVPLEGEDGKFLLEHRAEGLNALQFLLNKMVYRGGPTRILVDANGYRQQRQDELVARAREAAREVRDTGRARTMGSLNPFERRLIHLALREDADVRTVSHGEGFMKRIEIVPSRGGARESHRPGPGWSRRRRGRGRP